MRFAVVGHVEWCEFFAVPRMPEAGEIVEGRSAFEIPAGGGAVAAVQMARLAGECLFITALGDDELGRRAKAGLEELGVEVAAAWRSEPQRRALIHLDSGGGRTITTIGERLEPRGSDELPWEELEGVAGAYVTAADPAALEAARRAEALVATTRAGGTLGAAGVSLDALVLSARDASETYSRGGLEPEPQAVVRTAGADGGTAETVDGQRIDWEAAPLPGPRVDDYGAGDCFAAGLTFALGRRLALPDALALAARCGAACVSGAGPYRAQLRSDDLSGS